METVAFEKTIAEPPILIVTSMNQLASTAIQPVIVSTGRPAPVDGTLRRFDTQNNDADVRSIPIRAGDAQLYIEPREPLMARRITAEGLAI